MNKELLQAHIAHVRQRVLVDALLEGTSAYWMRRAQTFGAVGTPACDEIATACQRHAGFVRRIGLDEQARAALTRVMAS